MVNHKPNVIDWTLVSGDEMVFQHMKLSPQNCSLYILRFFEKGLCIRILPENYDFISSSVQTAGAECYWRFTL